MVNESMGCIACCCLGILILIIIGSFGGSNVNTSVNNVSDTVSDVVENATNNSIGLRAFKPTNFTFVYNDGNTTKYKGDLGLSKAYCTNEADNSTCAMDQEYVRGLAYASNGTFKFKENLSMVPYNFTRNDTDYTVYEIYHEDGTILKKLRIQDDLTVEQKKYFQDYEAQKSDYYLKKQQDTLDAMEEEQYDTYVATVKNGEKTNRGLIFGPNGASYYRSF